jgi:hypothetical protein
VLFGTNVPVPEVDQIPPLAIVTDPFNVSVALLAQTVTLEPALAVGAGVILTVIVVLTAVQPPLLVDVRVRVTAPAVISALLGR